MMFGPAFPSPHLKKTNDCKNLWSELNVPIATLMALFFGLFSMPASQAAPANGWAVGSAVKPISPINTIYYRRRRYGRCRRYRRYRW
jgi:hypothetical protein